MNLHQELEIIYSALQAELGIVVKTENAKAALQRMYRARKEAGDPDLTGLVFRRSPFNIETEFMIVKLAPLDIAKTEVKAEKTAKKPPTATPATPVMSEEDLSDA